MQKISNARHIMHRDTANVFVRARSKPNVGVPHTTLLLHALEGLKSLVQLSSFAGLVGLALVAGIFASEKGCIQLQPLAFLVASEFSI